MILPIKDKIKSLINKGKGDFSQAVVERLTDLPVKDSLHESVQILTELKEMSSLTLQEKLRSLYVVTLINMPHLTAYKKDRSKVKLNNKHLAESMEQLVNPYYRVLFDEYKALSTQLIEHKAEFVKDPKHIALFFCRMNIVAFEMLVWRYFDHQPTPEKTWNVLNKVYQFAELTDVLNVPVTLPENREITDVATLYARVLMLSTLEKATMNPKDLRAATELLKQNMLGIEFDNEYEKDKHHFYIDLYGEKGANHVRTVEHAANYRYWRTAELVQRIEDYLLAISMQKLPKDAVIRQIDSLPIMTRVLKKLNQEWSPRLYKRQRRASTRKKVEKTLYVAQGLTNISNQLSIFNGDKEIDMTFLSVVADGDNDKFVAKQDDQNSIEKWKMVDVSETGFAVDLGFEPSSWIEPGRLIGCQNPNHSHQYAIGEIKTIKKQSNGHYRAGVEILSSLSQAMHLNKVEEAQQKKEVATGFYLEGEDGGNIDSIPSVSCLYIPQSGTHGRQKSSLILPLAEYQPNKRFKIDAVDKMIQLGGAIDIHQDWVRAFVRII